LALALPVTPHNSGAPREDMTPAGGAPFFPYPSCECERTASVPRDQPLPRCGCQIVAPVDLAESSWDDPRYRGSRLMGERGRLMAEVRIATLISRTLMRPL
jgi:hypothetical protein